MALQRRSLLKKFQIVKDSYDLISIQTEIQGIVGEKLKKVERLIGEKLKSPYIPIAEMGVYLASSPGKRLRPTLLFLSSELVGYNGELDIDYAVTIEFVHTATLVHDDIVDQAILRRGRASLNSRWGSELAVLMGDYLYISAVQMAVNLGWNDIQPIIAETSKNLIEGELLQSHRGYDLNINEDEYIEIIKLKTAKLFATCTVIPPILQKKSKEEREALFNYGLFIGIAFQIVDDCLDFLSDEKTLGKPVGQDLKEGKVTLPLIYLRDYGKIQDKEFLEAIVAGRRFENSALEELSERVVSGEFAEMALLKAKEYAEKARSELNIFKDSKAKKLLEKLPDFILKRSF